MKHAYNDNYVSYAMEQMGELCEIATKNDFQDLDYFINDLFIPRAAEKIETCDPFFLMGKSSLENYRDITGHRYRLDSLECSSKEYWVGWVLAFTQWYYSRSFKELVSAIPASHLLDRYHPLHEANETYTARIFEEKILSKDLEVSDRIERDAIKVIEQYEHRDDEYATLFFLIRMNEAVELLSKGYLEDTKSFPWKELEKLAMASLDDKIDKIKLGELVQEMKEIIDCLEDLRKEYIVRIIKARVGDFHPSFLKEYEDKEKDRAVPRMIEKIKKSDNL